MSTRASKSPRKSTGLSVIDEDDVYWFWGLTIILVSLVVFAHAGDEDNFVNRQWSGFREFLLWLIYDYFSFRQSKTEMNLSVYITGGAALLILLLTWISTRDPPPPSSVITPSPSPVQPGNQIVTTTTTNNQNVKRFTRMQEQTFVQPSNWNAQGAPGKKITHKQWEECSVDKLE